MNLKEEMNRNQILDEKHIPVRITNLIHISKAIEIAEKYAIEMCKKQRVICKEHWGENWRAFEDHGGVIMDKAPLATDIK